MSVKSQVSHLVPAATPQSQPIPGREVEMVRNEAGGYGFVADDWARLDRWLILGGEANYYSPEQKVVLDNAPCLRRCIAADGKRVIARAVEISLAGRAPKNDAAILAIALAAKTGDGPTRAAAYAAMPQVCRIGTHLFAWAEAIDNLGGWGRGARGAVGRWYAEKEPDALAYQLAKYRQRDGWSHRDLLRLAHPKPNPLLAYAAGKGDGVEGLPRIIEGFERAQQATTVTEIVGLIGEYGLTREMIPTEFLGRAETWGALLPSMPLGAMVRNLGNLSRYGVVAPFSDGTKTIVAALGNQEKITKSRVHPMAILLGVKVYESGHGMRGAGVWTPVPQVLDALNEAFYMAMSNVEPTGKRHLIAVDVSGSMSGGWWGDNSISGIPIAPKETAAAMALVVARTEPNYLVIGFDTYVHPFSISPKMRLDDVVRMSSIGGGGTDCSLPFAWAEGEGLPVDAFVCLTDNATWAGNTHPAQALASYRRKINPQARSVCAAFTAVGTSILDKKDPLSLDCVGLDASLPTVISSFIAGDF